MAIKLQGMLQNPIGPNRNGGGVAFKIAAHVTSVERKEHRGCQMAAQLMRGAGSRLGMEIWVSLT